MDPLLGEFSAELQGISPMSPKVGIFSTVHEGTYVRPGGEPIHDVAYWIKGMRHSVYFTHGVRNAVDSGYTTFLELAPNPVALMQIGLTTAAAGLPDAQLIPTLARKQDDVESMISAMAQLFVFGHDIDIRTLFSRAAGPEDYANVPPTRFKRKEHWLDAHFSGDGSVMMPGTHVAMPDGRHVWEYAPRGETDLAALVKAAATHVLPDAVLTASEQRAVPADNARLVTTLTRHPGGAAVQIHARIDESFTLVYDALVSRAGQASVLPTAVGAGAAIAPAVTGATTAVAAPVAEPAADDTDVADIVTDSLAARQLGGLGRWSPDSGETVRDRLASIVSMAMGYEPEDLPWEVPLVELGLDSMMAVRIKNRVEYDFDMPPIQLQAVRDANLYNVEKLIEYAIENRDEVQELHERQKTQTAEEIAAEQAAMLAGKAPLPGAAPAAQPETQETEPQPESSIPPPPTNPAGPVGRAHPTWRAPHRHSTRKPLPRRSIRTFRRATRPSESRSRPGRSSPASPRAASSTHCRSWTTPPPPRWPSGSPSARKPPSPSMTSSPPPPSRISRPRCANSWRPARSTASCAPSGPGPKVPRPFKPPVFVFHAAGGSTVVYEPLLKRLPADTPMYGFERVEGTVEERAAQYLPKLRELGGDGPFILAGWSLGGVLAYACAIGLKQQGCDVPFVGLIDAVRAGEEVPQTKEETRKRWDRYARFAERTFNVEVPEIPYEHLETLDDEGQVKFVLEAVQQAGVQIPGGIIEHQRTSYLDHRAIDTVRDSSPTTATSRCTWPIAITTTRSRSSRVCDPQARRRLGRVRRRPRGRADRWRAHPGHRRADHRQGRCAYDAGAQQDSRRAERSLSDHQNHRRAADRTAGKAGAGEGAR